jgi:hypothetical protein
MKLSPGLATELRDRNPGHTTIRLSQARLARFDLAILPINLCNEEARLQYGTMYQGEFQFPVSTYGE